MRTLLVIRHAKSAWPGGVSDHDRPLAARGRADAPSLGRWLADRDLCPDYAAVSSALRTQQTWTLVDRELDCEVSVDTEERIYAAPASALLDVVRGFPRDTSVGALVGHNPGCEDLAGMLAGQGDSEAAADMARKFPTSGVAVIEFAQEWADVAPGIGWLTAFVVPRG